MADGLVIWAGFHSLSLDSGYGLAFPPSLEKHLNGNSTHRLTTAIGREWRSTFVNSTGYPFVDTGGHLVSGPLPPPTILWPDEWGAPSRFAIEYPATGTVTTRVDNAIPWGRTQLLDGDTLEGRFGHTADPNGYWYRTISFHRRTYRMYCMAHRMPGDYSGLRLFVYDDVTTAPSITPNGGAGGVTASIAGPSGSSITYKINPGGGGSDNPTPGTNGWSAWAATPVSVPVVSGDQLRAQSYISPKSPSNVTSASFT